MRRVLAGALLGAAVTAAGWMPQTGYAAYPDRPVTMIVPWGAGGGTDAVARFIATELEKSLKQPVNVVNRTGGSGVVGHQAIASAAADGYTLGLITVEIAMMRHAGLTKLSHNDFSAIALVNFDPNAVMVRADSPIKDAKALIDAARANPGKLKASGTGQGGIWHLGLAGWLVESKVAGNAIAWVPSQGAAPGLQDLAAGGVDVVSASLPEGRSLIEAGKVRAIVLMADKPDGLFPNVPLLKASGSAWTNGAWRGVAGPKGMPKEVVDRLATAVKQIYDSKAYKDFLSTRGFGEMWAGPADFAAFMGRDDAAKGEVMKAVGLAK
jgi:tripartite-type tricarboxylate transporter receptor subunit TctC